MNISANDRRELNTFTDGELADMGLVRVRGPFSVFYEPRDAAERRFSRGTRPSKSRLFRIPALLQAFGLRGRMV